MEIILWLLLALWGVEVLGRLRGVVREGLLEAACWHLHLRLLVPDAVVVHARSCHCGRRVLRVHALLNFLAVEIEVGRVLGAQLRVLVESGPRGDLVPVLVEDLRNSGARRDELVEQRRQRAERRVIRVVVPRANEDPVVRLQHEILLHVVDDERAVELPPQTTEVLHKDGPPGKRMLPVEPVVDQAGGVDLVDDPVRIVLRGCRENHDLVPELAHALQEFVHPRADVVVAHAVKLEVVHEGLVQV
mmetsp:Transcript_101922/g.287635  ORF Transcript_101922/g.287635 Transcript_101922/m.287635 type:complete len:246 (+) Transcript_101922:635-1372(+)